VNQLRQRVVSVLLLAGLGASLCVREASARKRRAKPSDSLIVAFGPERAYKLGDHTSPDKKWILRVSHPDTHLNVELLPAGQKKPILRAECVSGFIWAPKHPHRLLVSTGAVYGAGTLMMWEEGADWRHLARAKRPQDAYFRLHGVTSDGNAIVYGMAANIDDPSNAFYKELSRRRRLTLPKASAPVRRR